MENNRTRKATMEYGFSSTSKVPVQLGFGSVIRRLSKARSRSLEPASSATKLLYATMEISETQVEGPGKKLKNVLVPSSETAAKDSMDSQKKEVSLPNSSKKKNPEPRTLEELQINKKTESVVPSNEINEENSMGSQKIEVSLPNSTKKQTNKDIERPGKILKNVFVPSNEINEENSMDSQKIEVSLPNSTKKQEPEISKEELQINKDIQRPGKILKNIFVPSNEENSMDGQEKKVPLPTSKNKQNPETSLEELQINKDIERPEKILKNVLDPSKQSPETSMEELQMNEIYEGNSMDGQQKDVSLPNASHKKKAPKVSSRLQKKHKSSKSKIKKSQPVEFQKQLDDMQLQRDFYYSKCLRVEILSRDPKASTPNEVLQEILFSTEDGFGPPDEEFSIYQ